MRLISGVSETNIRGEFSHQPSGTNVLEKRLPNEFGLNFTPGGKMM